MREQTSRLNKSDLPAVPKVYSKPETNPVLREQKTFVLKTLNFQHQSVTRQRALGICMFALMASRGQMASRGHVASRGQARFSVFWARASW